MSILKYLTILPAIISLIRSIAMISPSINGRENAMEFAKKTMALTECINLVTSLEGQEYNKEKRYKCARANHIVKQLVPKQLTTTGISNLTFIKPCTTEDYKNCPLKGS